MGALEFDPDVGHSNGADVDQVIQDHLAAVLHHDEQQRLSVVMDLDVPLGGDALLCDIGIHIVS